MEKDTSVFHTLNDINVNDRVEEKIAGGVKLSYLSWTWAWSEIKKRYEDAKYEIVMHNDLPYVYDENTGYMVFTRMTIEGVTHEMWLPVMDSNNRAMKAKPYDVSFKSGKSITVQAATMFDINKTIMRCLVKNIAMFGLGLYIYAGEDLPEEEDKQLKEDANKKAKEEEENLKKIEAERVEMVNSVLDALKENGINFEIVKSLYKVKDLRTMSTAKCENILKHLDDIKKLQEEKENE